jgi:hypothetical protein
MLARTSPNDLNGNPMPKSDTRALVPDDFDVPQQLIHASFRLEPLGVEHNERDYAAWTGSMHHIQSTPGFVGEKWPHAMSLADNHGDLAKHADDFAERRGFTYTVLDANDDVIGCVYIYPGRTEQFDARVTSWVRVEKAALDRELYHVVTQWLAMRWPFACIDYAARPI